MPATRLAHVLAAGPALPHSDWSLGFAGLEAVLAELDRGHTEVVECGSGVSTVAIARALRTLGHGRVTSLEHDPAWAAATRRLLTAEDLGAFAKVVEAALEPNPHAEPGCGWYRTEALGELPAECIELLLVDGPPAGEPGLERSRYPALVELGDRLAPAAVVILDDIGRDGERWVLDRWEHERPIAFDRRAAVGIAVGCVC